MSNIAFLITYVTLFPSLTILAILISATTFVRAQRARLHTLHRLRSLEDEFILLVKTLEDVTTLAEADRRTMEALANELREIERRVESLDNEGAQPAHGENMTLDQSMIRSLGSQRRDSSASRAATQPRRTGSISQANHSRQRSDTSSRSDLQARQPFRILRLIQPAITITTPQQTRAPRPTQSTGSQTRTTYIPSPQTSIHNTQDRIIHAISRVLLSVEPALSTPQIESIIEQLPGALCTSLRDENNESHLDPFADPRYTPSSTLVNPPSPSSSFNFRSVFDTPPSSSTSLSGSTLLNSLSGSTLVNSNGSDVDDASLLMRTSTPRTYSRYSRYEELMLQRGSSILTPAQLAQVEEWEEELRAADGWVELGGGGSDRADTDGEDLGA